MFSVSLISCLAFFSFGSLAQSIKLNDDAASPFPVQCPNKSAPQPYVLELYFVLEASDATQPWQDAYSNTLRQLFPLVNKAYPQSRLGVGAFIDKPFQSSDDYCYTSFVSLTSDRRRVDMAVSLISWGPGKTAAKSSLDAIFYSAKRSETGFSPEKMTTDGRPLLRFIIAVTSSDYERPGQNPGIQKPNKGEHDYDCRREDYVGVEAVASVLKEYQIYPLVITTAAIAPKFEDFVNVLSQAGIPTAVSSMEDDAGDLFNVVVSALEKQICMIQDTSPPYGWCTC